MRLVTYGGAISLDGFLAAADGSIDWLHFSKDVQEVVTNYWKNVDTILMGRKTYEVSLAQNQKESDQTKEPAIRTYVFSRTIAAIETPGAELVSSDAIEFIRDLKQRQGNEICLMGGGELAQSLFAAGLIDQVGLNIHPVLLGSGIPVFRDSGHRLRLKLMECRTIDGGCILANYTVLHDGSL
ncbi:dihydrofolate reductase [Alloacidobacterium dinghuense]|uniref:Dihydrofolate reductase n=1 Tax=Alloacidobacterium dinghuense TaxID=2763107 RepID=A0A7G8BIR6_9BACT|nr:dihydrofolate reductase family protein [Alloacidobacterium dinghuense]QNI32436.1 dihydrofolate reductase [Alloacidobacterium dinghuense]